MLLCDTNVWLALALSGHAHHHAARAWLDTIDQPGVIHFCRATQQSFLRLRWTTSTVLGAYGNAGLTMPKRGRYVSPCWPTIASR